MFLYVCCVYILKYIKYNLLSVYNATLCMFSELTILKWITSWSVLPWGRHFSSILTIPSFPVVLSVRLRPPELYDFHASMSIIAFLVQLMFTQ